MSERVKKLKIMAIDKKLLTVSLSHINKMICTEALFF